MTNNTNPSPRTDLPLVCDLAVLTDTQRARLETLSYELFSAAKSLTILDNGYDITLGPADPELIAKAAEFITGDGQCCAFLQHTLTVEQGPGDVHLLLTGGPGAREAIAADLATLIPTHLTEQVNALSNS